MTQRSSVAGFVLRSTMIAAQKQAPYIYQINTIMFSSGTHTLSARAMDKAGNQAEASIPIFVQQQFGIEIISPTTGTTINKSNAIIKGRINMPEGMEIGVTINNMLAQQQGNDFAAIVPLQIGQNTITAIATNIYGAQEKSTIIINTENAQEQLRVTTIPTSGIMTTKSDGTTAFNITMSVETNLTNTIASYSWDTNGDSMPDQTGDLLTQITGTYQTPGLYFPTVSITDTMGNIYTETTIVNVLDRAVIDALLQAKWDGMRGAVINGNIDAALYNIMPGAQGRCRAIFSDPEINASARLSEISRIEVFTLKERAAQAGAIRMESDGEYAYPVNFGRDANGIWKILGF
jgi:hypothetical protein